MSLRPSGFWCDVCNEPMTTEMLLDKPIRGFKLSCSPTELHTHDNCEELLISACDGPKPDLLKGGPLKDLLTRVVEHNKKYEEKHGNSV